MTLVAADQLHDLLAQMAISKMIEDQIRTADVIAVTKTDLVSAPELSSVRDCLATMAPDTPIVEAQDPVVPSMLLRIGGRRPGAEVVLPEATLFDRHVTTRLTIPNPTTKAEINKLLSTLGHDVVRAKGIAAGPNGERWAIQVVGRRREVVQLADVEAEDPTDLVTISLPEIGSGPPDNLGCNQAVVLGTRPLSETGGTPAD